ncbi:hypothetical protein GCM10023334_059380 [Nonomuraea thailandensis]
MLDSMKARHSPAHAPLSALWAGSQGDYDRFQRGVEEWFVAEMQQLNRLYRRHTRGPLMVLSTLLTIFFTIDSFEYVQAIIDDNALRSLLSANDTIAEPLAARCRLEEGGSYCLSQPPIIQVFGNAPISMSFSTGPPTAHWNGVEWMERLITPPHWLGFIATIVALMFGAPFWWDRLMSAIGLGGANTEKASTF